MFIGHIYFKENHLNDLQELFSIVIPNDYRVFVDDYKIYEPEVWSTTGNYTIEVVLENQKEWDKLKKMYFANKYKKRAIPRSIHLL